MKLSRKAITEQLISTHREWTATPGLAPVRDGEKYEKVVELAGMLFEKLGRQVEAFSHLGYALVQAHLLARTNRPRRKVTFAVEALETAPLSPFCGRWYKVGLDDQIATLEEARAIRDELKATCPTLNIRIQRTTVSVKTITDLH